MPAETVALYNKHRPRRFADLRGNPELVAGLSRSLKDGKLPHALLLHGPSGTGKTTIARILASKLGCDDDVNYSEIDCPALDGVLEAVRRIKNQMSGAPLGAPCRLFYFDEVQALSRAPFAQQALLKMLEDCPAHVYFVLATTDPGKLIPTIRTRCTTYALRPLGDEDMRGLLLEVCDKEGGGPCQRAFDKIIEHAGGSARKALVMLGKVLALDTEEEQLAAVEAGDEERQAIELARMLMFGKARWADVAKLLKELAAEDHEQLRRMVLGYAAGVLLNGKPDERAAALIDAFRDHWHDCGRAGLVAACYSMVRK